MAADITEFSGEHRWLSNFYECDVTWASLHFPSVEHAYQAAKTHEPMFHNQIRLVTAGQAKRLGQKVPLRPDWEELKLVIMEYLLIQKFMTPSLRAKLINTGDVKLVEGNHWGDTFWGVCNGQGHNHLGRLLMQVRSKLRDHP